MLAYLRRNIRSKKPHRADPTGSPLQALFSPTSRYRDSPLNRRGPLPEGWTEVELLQGLLPEDILATGIALDDFCVFRRNKVVWMTPEVYVSSNYMSCLGDPLVLALGVGVGTYMFVRVRSGTDAVEAVATCDFLVRLLATSELRDVYIQGSHNVVPPPVSGAALTLFFQESRSCLRKFTLNSMTLSEDQCLALATMSRLDVEVEMSYCSPTDDAAGAFVECVKSDRGPAELSICNIDRHVLATALTGASRVTRIKPVFEPNYDAEKAVVFTALANNRGLLHQR
jgi:hypothetical protein